jgi:hypothetical protein
MKQSKSFNQLRGPEMRENATSFILIMLCILFLGSSGSVNAQGTLTLFLGGPNDVSDFDGLTPYALWFSQSRHQYLILKSDIVSTGLNVSGPMGFKSLSFYLAAKPTGISCQNFTIKMKNTTLSRLAVNRFDNVGLMQVFGPETISPFAVSVGWNEHTFFTPFVWDGNSNILVDVCHDNGNWNWSWGGSWSIRYRYMGGLIERCIADYFDSKSGQMCTWPTFWDQHSTMPSMQIGLCDIAGSETAFSCDPDATVPGSIIMPWSISHPTMSFVASLDFQLYTASGIPVGAPQSTANISVVAGVISSGTFSYDATGVAPGYYRIEARFTVLNECNLLQEVKQSRAILLLSPGMTMCTVWPGDVNNDGRVNYGDRKALNKYIYNANLRSSWLQGYARYRADQASNPMTYQTWEPQPGLPWNTDDGCYMDTDGNGIVNSFDYMAIKLNWMKTHGSPRPEEEVSPLTFGMSQNYPNPFNPSTTIKYSTPEPSDVRLTVMHRMGRTVATLINKRIETGLHEVEFDAAGLASGHYWAHIDMVGVESGLTYRKTIKMTLLR